MNVLLAFAWVMLVTTVLGVITSRALTRREAMHRLRPELDDLRDVILAAKDSGSTHVADKIDYALELLEELRD